jgi:hypothetical protein
VDFSDPVADLTVMENETNTSAIDVDELALYEVVRRFREQHGLPQTLNDGDVVAQAASALVTHADST